MEKSFDETTAAVNGPVTTAGNKLLKKTIRMVAEINTKVPALSAKLASLDVALAKGVISYCDTCIKQYK